MKTRILLLLAFALVVGFGCDEDRLTELNTFQDVPDNFFQNQSQIEASLFSAYSSMRSPNLAGRLYFFVNDMMDDAHLPTSALFPVGTQLANGTQNSTSGEIGTMWSMLYQMVHRANTTIAGIENNTTLDESVLNPLMGEARFLRGWAYNELATLFGGVPLRLEPVSNIDGIGRSSREEIFAQAQADLQFAVDNLPLDYSADFKGRATRGAAQGFLARSYMQANNLTAARAVLEAIVNEGQYSLNPDFYDNFEEENDFLPESLFEVSFAPIGDFNWNGNGTGVNAKSVRAQEYGPFWRNVTPNSNIIATFEHESRGDAMTDPRFDRTVVVAGEPLPERPDEMVPLNGNGPMVDFLGEQKFVNWYKYGVYYKEIPGGYRTTNTNLIMMRYADVLLLLAEIEAREGNLQASRDYVNQVRSRVGLMDIENSNIPNGSQAEMIEAVIRERAVELASEQVRARDLRRWAQFGVINGSDYLSYWEDKHLLLPIPLNEINDNNAMTVADQNPGYN